MDTKAPVEEKQKNIEVFCCYARKDKNLLIKLKIHLMPLQHEKIIVLWSDIDIDAGTEWEEEIRQHLNTARIILLLVSPDFVASDYCYGIEMQQALERHERGEAQVIPIILRPVSWKKLPFSKLQALPTNTAPITSRKWHNQDDAFYSVVEGIREAIEALSGVPIDLQNPRDLFNKTDSIYDQAIPHRFSNPQDFVGRDEMLTHLKKRLLSNQSVTLTALNGLPGVGKTALAIELVHTPEVQEHFRDGILWAGVGYEPNIREILRRWGRLLGLSDKEMANLSSDTEWATKIGETIGSRRMLLVIDDVWKRKDTLAFLLDKTPCQYLITTRFPSITIDVGGGMLVEELDEDNGLRLLGRFVPELVKADPEGIRKLEQAVGGLPLALRLMGLYLRHEAHANQERRIVGALKELREAERRLQLEEKEVLDHHPSLPEKTSISLQAVIEISYMALKDEIAQQAFRGLSVFPSKPNTFSEEAALAIANISVETLDYLVDAGLVEHNRPGRYTLHQTIFDYATLKRIIAEKRMAEHFADYVDLLSKTSERELEVDEANISKALEFAHKHEYNKLVIRLCIGMQHFWHNRGLVERSQHYLQWGIAAAEAVSRETHKREDHLHQADLAFAYGLVLRRVGELDKAIETLEANLAIRHEEQDFNGEGIVLSTLGRIAHTRGSIKEAEEYCQKALVLHREIGNRKEEGVDLSSLGQIAQTQGDFEKAQHYYEQSFIIRKEKEDRRGEGMDLCFLGMTKLARRQLAEAEKNYNQSLAILQKEHEQAYEGVVHSELGYLAYLRGQQKDAEGYHEDAEHCYEIAELSYQEAREIVLKGNDRLTQCVLFPRIAALEATKGDLEESEKLYRQGLDVSVESGYAPNIADSLLALGSFLVEKKNQREEGCTMLLEAVQRYGTMGIFREKEAKDKLKQTGCNI